METAHIIYSYDIYVRVKKLIRLGLLQIDEIDKLNNFLKYINYKYTIKELDLNMNFKQFKIRFQTIFKRDKNLLLSYNHKEWLMLCQNEAHVENDCDLLKMFDDQVEVVHDIEEMFSYLCIFKKFSKKQEDEILISFKSMLKENVIN